MIRKRGSKYVVVSEHTGKTLGTHETKDDAQKQIDAINMGKARTAGHRLPKKQDGR